MKKTLKIKLIINLILLFTVSTSMLAQWAITTKNGTIGVDYLKVDDDCGLKACFNTYIYSPNQVPFDGSFVDNNGNSIPPMYLRVKIKDIDQTFELTNWNPFYNAEYLFPPYNYVDGVYKSTVCVDIELFEECLTTLQPDDTPVTLDPFTFVYVPYFKELLTYPPGNQTFIQDGDLVPYPICEFTNPSSIFSCEIFGITQPFCSNPAPTCYNSDLYHFNGSLKPLCEDCITANSEGGGGKNVGGGGQSGGANNSTNWDFKISPNPFSNDLFIEIPENNQQTHIELYDPLGQKIKSLKTNDPQLSIPTNDLKIGFYYLIMRKGDIIETFKILKQ